MANYCSCRAELPPDALFCHRCGKPQREDLIAVQEEPPSPPVEEAEPVPAAAPAAPIAIGFGNRIALRSAMVTAALAFLMLIALAPLPPLMVLFLQPLLLVAAGFLAVYLYHRRTGQPVSLRGGAKMGWITGILYFALWLLLFAAGAFRASGEGGLSTLYRDALEKQPWPEGSREQMLRLLDRPEAMALLFLFGLVFSFVFYTLLPVLGGALSAKVLDKD